MLLLLGCQWQRLQRNCQVSFFVDVVVVVVIFVDVVIVVVIFVDVSVVVVIFVDVVVVAAVVLLRPLGRQWRGKTVRIVIIDGLLFYGCNYYCFIVVVVIKLQR